MRGDARLRSAFTATPFDSSHILNARRTCSEMAAPSRSLTASSPSSTSSSMRIVVTFLGVTGVPSYVNRIRCANLSGISLLSHENFTPPYACVMSYTRAPRRNPMSRTTTNQDQPWTDSDVAELQSFVAEEMSIEEMAEELGRTPDAIRAKLAKEEISLTEAEDIGDDD